MKLSANHPCREKKASALIIVLWTAFGLVSLALYFAHSMAFELRVADNRSAGAAAEQAIAGATRYVEYVLANQEETNRFPHPTTYLAEAVPVGDAMFWLIGQPSDGRMNALPVFRLVDEAGKLNLNTASREMLEALPGMTTELAAAIIDWRDEDDEPEEEGAESDVYQRLKPPYKAKNAPFESIEELRLVRGATVEILFGEDANFNGILDPNENDGDLTMPLDNRDGRLDAGILSCVTVHSKEPGGKINVGEQDQRDPLRDLLTETFSEDRANEIIGAIGGGGGIDSLIEFYVRSEMTIEEFTQVEARLTASDEEAEGLININTASEAVLACIPEIGPERAGSVVAYRESNAGSLQSVAWLVEALDEETAIAAGSRVTGLTYQVTADVAAVGQYGRGYRRARVIIDNTGEAPVIVARRDLTGLGWALSGSVREQLELAQARR